MNLKNKTVVITAGPTYEKIDPVRFIGNHSSGKMGFSLAKACLQKGADVVLITGPTQQEILASEQLKRINIVTADEMFEQSKKYFTEADVFIMSAAVADYKPRKVAEQKIKKKEASLTIELEPTQDILKYLGQHKQNQILVGFALETNNEIENAKGKLTRKNLDFIVLNSLQDKNAGFGYDTNKITIIDKENNTFKTSLKTKDEIAKDVISYVENYQS